MKKWICLLLCLLLAGTALISAGAEGPMVFEITAEKSEVLPGDELTFTVTVQSTDTCKSYGLLLEFDSAVFEITGGECTAEGALLGVFDPEKGFAVLLENAGVPGQSLGTFTLRVKENAPAGETVVSGSSSVKNGDDVIASEVKSATLTVSGSAAPEETGAPGTEETGAPAQENETQPDNAPQDQNSTAEPEAPGQTQWVENVSATAPVLGEKEEQAAQNPGILMWILIAAGVLLAALAAWLVLLARIRKKKGKYMRNG